MEDRFDSRDRPDHERLRLGITVFVLAMIPVVVVGALLAGAGYGVVGPPAGLVGLLAIKVVSYYFD